MYSHYNMHPNALEVYNQPKKQNYSSSIEGKHAITFKRDSVPKLFVSGLLSFESGYCTMYCCVETKT